MAITRVVNAHREALRAGFGEFYRACSQARGWDQEAADLLISAILSARDGDTFYVVGTRSPHGATEIYGPFASYGAARRAAESGITATTPGSTSWVFPLYPTPKRKR